MPTRYKETWDKLQDAGWKYEASNPHDKAIDPNNPNHKIPVPHKHSSDLPKSTARKILKEAGLL